LTRTIYVEHLGDVGTGYRFAANGENVLI